MRGAACILLTLVLVLFAASAPAQIPRIINYQGILMQLDGQPIPDGEYQLTFSLYDETNTPIWAETHSQVFVGAGMFQVMLGIVTPLGIPFDEPYFLGVQVGNDPELQPRMPVGSVAYAIRAEDADKLMGIYASPTPEPNKLLPLDSSGKFPASVMTGSASGDFLKRNEPDTSRATSSSPVLLVSNLGDGDGINGRSTDAVGIAGQSTNNDGVTGWTGASGRSGILGMSTEGRGVTGRSDEDDGIVGWTGTSEKSGIYGHSTEGIGVSGISTNNDGVFGQTEDEGRSGVLGHSNNGTGVWGSSTNYNGMKATTKSREHAALAAGNEGAGPGLYVMGGTNGTAAIFKGNVELRSASSDAVILELGEGLDYAEGFDFSNTRDIGPGTVVIVDEECPGNLAISNRPYDRKVAGIVAGANGLGSGVRLGDGRFDKDVALAGRVYCNVDASYGEVAPGDLLTTSPTPGYAMVVHDYGKAAGAILGKAMERLPEGQKGQILVLVTLQ